MQMVEPMTREKRLLPKADFCRIYGVGHTTFYSLVNSGQLRALKLGSRTFVEVGEAERWKASLPAYKPAAGAR
jgi:hypothetical protein